MALSIELLALSWVWISCVRVDSMAERSVEILLSQLVRRKESDNEKCVEKENPMTKRFSEREIFHADIAIDTTRCASTFRRQG